MSEETAVKIESVRVDYMQEEDSCSSDGPQVLTVETQDAGGGPYLVISTTRWAIERPEDLLPLLRRVLALAEPPDDPAASPPAEDSVLVRHALQEMRAAGLYEPGASYGTMLPAAVEEIVRLFDRQGHSGGSAGMAIGLLEKLLRYDPLVPLTGKDDEWGELGSDRRAPAEPTLLPCVQAARRLRFRH